MFSSTTLDSVGFDSVSKEANTSTDVSLQTSATVVESREEQSRDLSDKNIQTETSSESRRPKYDENKLLNFLNRVTGPLLKELDKIEHSKAFTVQKQVDDDEVSEQVKELYILTGQPRPEIPEVQVSALAWSCTGSVIAVGYGRAHHEGWCTHESMVNFYNINSYKFDGKKPAHCIKTDSCITTIAMHPYEPSIVALGTFSGNIELWSVGKDNKIDGICLSKEEYHEEEVTQLSWANDTTQQLILISSSMDGRMCILKKISAGGTQLLDKYLLDQHNPDVLKAGVCCFSFCQHQPGIFVAGLQSGQLMLCSTFGMSKTLEDTDSESVEQCPILRPLDKKIGPITCVKFSPYEEHVFLAASSDMKITIYSIKEDRKLIEMYSDYDIIGADWSLAQTNIIIVWGPASKLYAYTQDTAKFVGELLSDDEETSKHREYQTAVFNSKSTRTLAVGGTDGNAYIWKYPLFSTE